MYRGFLLPTTVVEDYGGTRTDPGLLGHALYFADSIRFNRNVQDFLHLTAASVSLIA